MDLLLPIWNWFPTYEGATHNKLVTQFGPSMGTTHNAIPVRLDRGEAIDVVIMAGPALDELIKQGKVVRAAASTWSNPHWHGGKGWSAQARHQHCGSVEENIAGSEIVAYSDSASGVYLSTELFPKLGIANEIKAKSEKSKPTRSEVSSRRRIRNRLPTDQRTASRERHRHRRPAAAGRATRDRLCGGIPTTAKHPEAARKLIEWLASPVAYPAIKKSGLQPANSSPKSAH